MIEAAYNFSGKIGINGLNLNFCNWLQTIFVYKYYITQTDVFYFHPPALLSTSPKYEPDPEFVVTFCSNKTSKNVENFAR